jgi:hypothetical protein
MPVERVERAPEPSVGLDDLDQRLELVEGEILQQARHPAAKFEETTFLHFFPKWKQQQSRHTANRVTRRVVKKSTNVLPKLFNQYNSLFF